jgi:hypothetical protein
MALSQYFWVLLILFSYSRADDASTQTTVFKFSPLHLEENYLVIQPKNVPVTNLTGGYSICLRALFWSWNNAAVFDSPAVTLLLNLKHTSGNYELCIFSWCCMPLANASVDWNSICITHDFSYFFLEMNLNNKINMRCRIVEEVGILENATFLERLMKPFHIGKDSLFWGQISDFNVWSRPLSTDEITEYSFNSEEEFSKTSIPEILAWSNASIKEIGNSSQHFEKPRALLICHNNSGSIPPQKSQYFGNSNFLGYLESIQFCQFLKGDLLLLNNSEMCDDYTMYWVPIIKSNYTSKWQYDKRVLNLSEEEVVFPLILQDGAENELCLSIFSNTYIPISCENNTEASFCQAPAEGLVFKVITNSTSKCTAEVKYNLFGERSRTYFAGINGKLIIENVENTWVIYENNFDLKERKRIGIYVSENQLNSADVFNVIGIHQIECNNSDTKGTVLEYLKISNVSVNQNKCKYFYRKGNFILVFLCLLMMSRLT